MAYFNVFGSLLCWTNVASYIWQCFFSRFHSALVWLLVLIKIAHDISIYAAIMRVKLKLQISKIHSHTRYAQQTHKQKRNQTEQNINKNKGIGWRKKWRTAPANRKQQQSYWRFSRFQHLCLLDCFVITLMGFFLHILCFVSFIRFLLLSFRFIFRK